MSKYYRYILFLTIVLFFGCADPYGYSSYGSPTAANNITIPNPGIVTLRHITPIPLDRQVMVIHITQATHGKGIRSRVKLRKKGPNQVRTDADRAAALPIDESTGC